MDTTQDTRPPSQPARPQPESLVPALVVAYCLEEPWRVGQVILFADSESESYLGRGAALDDEVRAVLVQQRPTGNVERPPLQDQSLSRIQVKFVRTPDSLFDPMLRAELLVSEKTREMRVNGEPCKTPTSVIGQGETLQIRGSTCKLLVYSTLRPRVLPGLLWPREEMHPFGWADEHGIAGESLLVWRLRDRLTFAGRAGDPVLLSGPSGSEKERAARALHRLSDRSGGPFVATSPAILKEDVTEADLFGKAHGGTLFIDDIGMVSPRVKGMLLRALQEPDPIKRVRASRTPRPDVRVIGATSGRLSELEPDLAARFPVEVEVPGLNDRREDIPLLMQEIALRFLQSKPGLRERFVFVSKHFYAPDWVAYEFVRFDPALIDMLLRWTYARDVHELGALVRKLILESEGNVIEASLELKEALDRQIQARMRLKQSDGEKGVEPAEVGAARDARLRDVEHVLRALCDATSGSKSKAAKALGISRQRLDRWLDRLGIRGGAEESRGEGAGGVRKVEDV